VFTCVTYFVEARELALPQRCDEWGVMSGDRTSLLLDDTATWLRERLR
jgi:hypothetical protein